MNIDIESLLDECDINYEQSRKNVGQGWYGIEECPNCGAGGYHCGITPDGGGYSCFVCGRSGGIAQFLCKILRIPYNKAQEILSKYSSNFYHAADVTFNDVPDIILPGQELGKAAMQYLLNRGLHPYHLVDNYGIIDGGITGDYKYRIIIPIYINHQLVSFIARDYTGLQTLRYTNLSIIKSKIPLEQCLYNWDVIGSECLLVEGVFDVMKMGSDCCGALGVVMTKAQILLLQTLKRVVICFDYDKAGQVKAVALASTLSFCGVDVVIAKLPQNVTDPAEMTTEQVRVFKNKYGF